MAQVNAFDLDRFNQALFYVHQLLDDADVGPSQKTTLNAWWGRRSAKLNQQLMQRLPHATTAQERLFLRLASVLLQPQQSGIEARVTGEIEDYAIEIEKWITIERSNLTGDVRPRRAGIARAVVTEQIEDLDKLVREIRSVIYAWEDVKSRAALTDNKISSKIENLKTTYLANRSSSSAPSESLIELLSGLIRLEEVVAYVDGNLTTAYREDLQGLWVELEQKLHGYRDVTTRDNWVHQQLQQHISYRWIETAKSELKQNRNGLQMKMDDIVRLLKYQDIEAAQSLDDRPTSGQSSDEQAVRRLISEERQRSSILQERSVLEMARDNLIYIKEHALLDDYKEYTKNADQSLSERLTRKLIAADILPRQQSLDQYLDARIETIANLREILSPVVGRASSDNAGPLTVYRQVHEKAVQYARSAQFDKARASCSEREAELAQTITTLEECYEQAVSSLPGMARRLLGVIGQETNRLKAEKGNITQVKDAIDALERDYHEWQEKFDVNLAEWRRRNEGRWLDRFRRADASHFLQIARQAFCECQNRCPDADWIRTWMNMGAKTLGECDALDETQWIQRYLAAPPIPEKVAS